MTSISGQQPGALRAAALAATLACAAHSSNAQQQDKPVAERLTLDAPTVVAVNPPTVLAPVTVLGNSTTRLAARTPQVRAP